MKRSVEELRRESEYSRAQLAATVDRLKDQITDTAEDLRYKVSPEGIKAEVSEFISQKTHGWADTLKRQAMENPMQAIAAGTAIAVPALRLARSVPLPLLIIGAGLALTSKTVRGQAIDAAAPGIEKAKELLGQATEGAQSARDGMREAMTYAERQASGMAGQAKDAAAGMVDAAGGMAKDLKDRVAQTAETLTGKVKAGVDATSEMAKDTFDSARLGARTAAEAAPTGAAKVLRDNAALIGGLGVALGALLAASLPGTKAEAGVMGKASDSVKRAAGNATEAGFEAAKDTVLSAADAMAKSVSEADLGGHASRIVEDVTGRLKEVAEDVVTTAFDPSRNPQR